ncbi:MAG: uroporphyrinogen-III C-methyltransferase [Candidatus Tectomicrobia bacterium]|nr:uroporphyrinogen-III C-methyltransferase [Candidatus Tectomicrobia bacterium]
MPLSPREESSTASGRVAIVGAGPGDPDLLTLRAARLIARAGALVHDRLLSPEILDKGGDPFVFGRGGEEAEALAQAGVPFEVVPGVTSAVAAPAFAGIPVTHRGLAASVTFVTAHEDPAKESGQVDYAHLARAKGTLVFLMGARSVGRIARSLIGNGMPARTPVAIVENGSTPRQRTLRCRLGGAARLAEREEVAAPAVVVVGEVAALADSLAWFQPEAAPEMPCCRPPRDEETLAARALGARPGPHVRTP